MRKAIYLIVIVLCSALGTYLLGSYGDESRGKWRLLAHMGVIDRQLSELKDLLIRYRAIHGGYPTNDEGLAVLDGFDGRFKTVLYQHVSRPGDSTSFYSGLSGNFLEDSKQAIKDFRAKHSRAPQNAQEFQQPPYGMFKPERPSDYVPVDVELGITEADDVFLLSPAGVLSPWMVPYIYENRIGMDRQAFADSPAGVDTKRRYSVEVDKGGVYVYSVGGQLYAEKLDSMQWDDTQMILFGLGLLLAALVFTALMFVSSAAAITGTLALIGSAAIAFSFHYNRPQELCYMMSPLFSDRNPELVPRQKELLDKYRDAGVLGDQAYHKAMAALDGTQVQQSAMALRQD